MWQIGVWERDEGLAEQVSRLAEGTSALVRACRHPALLAGLEEDGTVLTALQALERSLRSLEAVEEVRFLVDGEFRRDLGPFDGEEE